MSSTTFLMFQYNKYKSDLLKRREVVSETSGGSGSGLELTVGEQMEAILTDGAVVSNSLTNNDK